MSPRHTVDPALYDRCASGLQLGQRETQRLECSKYGRRVALSLLAGSMDTMTDPSNHLRGGSVVAPGQRI
jgi:hypothetical protein